jgi:hypothetical protein
MENQTSSNNPSENLNNQPKKRRVAWIIIASIVILVALFLSLGGYGAIKQYYNNIQERKNMSQLIKGYDKMMDVISKTLTEDIYGGKTPQETLNMFIDALEKGDIELAGKYFALDVNLSRQELVDGLSGAIQNGKLEEILQFLKSVEKSPRDFTDMDSYELVMWNKDRSLVDRAIRFELNKYSNVWKISGF